MANRKLRSAIRGSTEALDDVVNFLLEMKKQKEEKERQAKEDERADRKEARAVERLGMAREGHDYAMGAEDREKKAEEDRIYKEEQLPAWQGRHEVLKRTGELAGIQKEHEKGVSGLKGREMALPAGVAPTSAYTKKFESPGNVQRVQDSATSMEVGIMKMSEMLGGARKRDEHLAGQSESVQDYYGHLEAGASDATARDLTGIIPEKPPKPGDVTERDDFLQEKVYQWRKAFTGEQSGDLESSLKNQVGWDGEKETLVYYRDIFIANQLQMTPEEQELHLGRVAGLPGQVTKPGTPKTEVAPTKQPTEEINTADHAPAGEKPQDVEAFVIGYINAGKDIALIDTAKLAKEYDMDEEEVKTIVSHFANTAGR